jgi:hypothetical protein
METSSAPRASHDNALEAAQSQPSTPQGLAVFLTPEYDPSLPLPANPFSHLSTTERLGFLSPVEYLAQAVASETANASSLFPLRDHTPAFIAAYTPLDDGENLFQDLDPVADKARLFNIVSGFVARDGREARTPDVVNQEMEKETILVTKKVVGKWKGPRGKRGRAKHKGKKSNPSVFAELDDPSKIEKAAGRVVGGDGREKDHGAFDDTQVFLLTEVQEEENDGDEAAAEKRMSVKNKVSFPQRIVVRRRFTDESTALRSRGQGVPACLLK